MVNGRRNKKIQVINYARMEVARSRRSDYDRAAVWIVIGTSWAVEGAVSLLWVEDLHLHLFSFPLCNLNKGLLTYKSRKNFSFQLIKYYILFYLDNEDNMNFSFASAPPINEKFSY